MISVERDQVFQVLDSGGNLEEPIYVLLHFNLTKNFSILGSLKGADEYNIP